MTRPVALVGFMGAGKSTVGRLLAGARGVTFADADAAIEAADGRPVPQIFAEDGERAFRGRERDVVAELLAPGGPGVVALGGGAVLDPATRAELAARATVVWLDVDVDTAWSRIWPERAHRPLAVGRVALPRPARRAPRGLRGGGRRRGRRRRRSRRGRGGLPGRAAGARRHPRAAAGAPGRPDRRGRRRRGRGRPPAGRAARAARGRGRGGGQDRRRPWRGCGGRWRPPTWNAATSWSRSAAARSPTPSGSPPRPSGAACSGSPRRRPWWARSTPRSAARPASTSRRRTTWAPSTCPRRCWPTPRCS